ncbi:MAG: aspartate--tRNA ligase [Candidatus Omnitrophota bacterium]|jgi:aspartyl-tRNA synthetase
MLRTHTCGQLVAQDIGTQVTLCGWVGSRRDHGKIIFVDLRDRYGITQIVFAPDNKQVYETAKQLGNEYVILVQGKANQRPKGTENPKLNTGEIEILAEKLTILNASCGLPFEIKEDINVSGDLRLKYRYLDLRRKQALDNLLLRHNVYYAIRTFLNKQQFIDVETPILTRSTPEGARDFLVPSRLLPGQFYALPQSPQLFKQILMIAGFDRYYQIARCFRDEDLRADRQPEFTQLDLEMSFVEQEDVFNLIEQLIQYVFAQVLGIKVAIPFPRLDFEQAIKQYQTDKPDLRDSKNKQAQFAFVWVTGFPLFKYDENEKRWVSEHHPFTAPEGGDVDLSGNSFKNKKALAYDLVLNGTEIGSGSIRIHQPQLQEKIFKIIGIDEQEAIARFGFLIEALKYGAPPHGGFAIGIDRFLSLLVNEKTIREIIAFPKTQSGWCLLTDAPSAVDKKQLEELNLQIKDQIKSVRSGEM